MKVLITGARLPAALEIARAFAKSGATVTTADTTRFGFAASSRFVRRYVRLPSPVFDYQAFRSAALDACEDQDLVIPVSEEIYFLSKLKDQIPLFAPEFERLRELHSKLEFQKYAGYQIAPTHLVKTESELHSAVSEFGDVVVKSEFSRGAIGTLVKPKDFSAIRLPTLVQKFIDGPEICSYSIAHKGRVVAHVTYEPRYRYGHGASVYFRSVEDDRTLQFVQSYAAKINLTGQIAFDFIATEQGLVALECNPRTTSGIHLLTPGQISQAFLDPSQSLAIAPKGISRSAKLTLLMTNIVTPKDFFAAKDTAFQWADPAPFLSQFASGAELMMRARRWKMPVSNAFGYDIEWNGEAFE